MDPLAAMYAIGSEAKAIPTLPEEKFSLQIRNFIDLCLKRYSYISLVREYNHCYFTIDDIYRPKFFFVWIRDFWVVSSENVVMETVTNICTLIKF